MFKKVLVLGVLATTLVGLTMVVGCGSADGGDTSTGESEEALAQSAGGMLGGPQQAAPSRAQPSQVTCSGDQNNGGRICCDATHCCININGVINCNLPAPTRKAQ